MGIINGSFESFLEGWEVYTSGSANIGACRSGGGQRVACLYAWGCADASLEQEFIIDGSPLSFFWMTYTSGSPSVAEWLLKVEGNVVYRQGFPVSSALPHGTITVDTSRYIGKRARIIFRITGCGSFTALDIDNVYIVPYTGSVNFSSEPQGAMIYIDNIDTRISTPAMIDSIPIGTHSYTLKLDGYEDYSGTIEILKNSVSYISVVLIPLTGSINFSSEPQGAMIFLNDMNTGIITPTTIEKVPVGMHTYTLRLDGYKDYSGTIEIQPGMISYVYTVLIPRVGNLYIVSIPPRADIYIDGVYQDVTTPALITGIKVGIHTFRLVKGLEYSGTVEILDDQTVGLQILLAETKVPEERIPVERIPFERMPFETIIRPWR